MQEFNNYVSDVHIESVKYEFTGGGIISFWGKLDNGHWFIVDTDDMFNEYDTDIEDFVNFLLYDGDVEYDPYEFDQEHIIRMYFPTEDMANELIRLTNNEDTKAYIEASMEYYEGKYGKIVHQKDAPEKGKDDDLVR